MIPRRLRADWRQEWEAELRYRESLLANWNRLNRRTRLDLFRRSLGAFWDAIRLQPRRLEDEMFQDLRFGARTLIRQPAFTIVSLVTLGLGIGVNTAIFSIVDSVLLRPLPFKDPSRLVAVWESNVQRGQSHGATGGANFTDWKNQNDVFDSIAAYFTWNYNLTGRDEPVRLTAALVSGGFFQMLGERAALGRVLAPQDDTEANENVVVLSSGLWRDRFGASREILGQTITLNGIPHTVVGVMPPAFDFPNNKIDLWRPMAMSPEAAQNREGKWLRVAARLKPGVSIERAESEMNTIAKRLAEEYPKTNAGCGVHLVPLHEEMVGNVRTFLLALFGAVLFVLLISCLNVANLILARGSSRRTEMAIRSALGAVRLRLLRQFLVENFLLAGLGAALGLLLAFWSLDALIALSPADVPGLAKARIDGRVLGFSGALSMATALVFGLIPALRASKPDLNEVLKQGRTTTGGNSRRIQHVLIIAEVAVGVVLLIGAGLMTRSFVRLENVEPGFNPKNLLTMKIMLPANKYGENEKSIAFFHDALERIKAVPGVASAGAIQDLPMSKNEMKFAVSLEDVDKQSQRPEVAYRSVTADYFKTMGIPLLSGRAFSVEDNLRSTPVVIINQTMARRFWPNADPIGKRIRMGEPSDPVYTVVGVVGDIKQLGLTREESPAIYQPHEQKRFGWLRWMSLVVRTRVTPMRLVAAIRSRIADVDNSQPVYDISTMDQMLSESVSQQRFATLLLGIFALLALILSGVGVYGVISFGVTQRTREIGLRMALGANARDVSKMIVLSGLRLTLTGLGLGFIGATALTDLLQALIFNVKPTDPLTLISVFIIFMLVTFVSSYLPARRASRLDPQVALRRD
jgi:putative ABC transport system permease protein